ncbi:uncharacterized protein LOC122378183 [Amphibalanus amphitrite]|uniref:uncharacterized protein LOC122378183 n=1 Tax=Amphibalanus amphitrite TaxID=1232801 RepID=UPI001C905ED2|nr:uncharacterized protein LOC122378183 [Amphibalanus amphitrite]
MCTTLVPLVGLLCVSGCFSLTMDGISVSGLNRVGDDVILECGFVKETYEESQGTVNVTWHKDGMQFYHSVNNGNSKIITVKETPGIKVNESRSGFGRLTLMSLEISSSGSYGCSATSVKNSVTSGNKTLFVMAPPTTDPVLSGLKKTDWIPNGLLEINCTAGKSLPAANITWSVDGKPVERNRLIEYPTEVDEDGLETSRLGLSIQLGHDIRNEIIYVTCDAVVEKTVTQPTEKHSTLHRLRFAKTVDKTLTPPGAGSGSAAGHSSPAAPIKAPAGTPLLLLLLLLLHFVWGTGALWTAERRTGGGHC